VATLLAFVAHELAENPEIQTKLREEIDQAINDDGLTYDSVMGMKYLEMVVSGSINIYMKLLRF
jgi:cytochrome P450